VLLADRRRAKLSAAQNRSSLSGWQKGVNLGGLGGFLAVSFLFPPSKGRLDTFFIQGLRFLCTNRQILPHEHFNDPPGGQNRIQRICSLRSLPVHLTIIQITKIALSSQAAKHSPTRRLSTSLVQITYPCTLSGSIVHVWHMCCFTSSRCELPTRQASSIEEIRAKWRPCSDP
jgi:hypothetical protein